MNAFFHSELQLPEPTNYYTGVDAEGRPISRNALLFLRTTRQTLQQRHLANRMHHRYVLVLVLETPGVVSVDGMSLRVEEGEALLVAPFQFHHYLDTDAEKLRWLFITFELQQGDAIERSLCHRRLRMDAPTRDSILQIVELWKLSDVEGAAELLPVLDLVLMRLLRSAEARPSRKTGEKALQNEWIIKVEGLVIRSVGEGWTLDDVARQVGLSERHLRTRFEAATGVSLRDYRSNYQFHRAIALMHNPKMNLSEIGVLCGFNSQAVFSRFIKRQTRQSPRQLRAILLSKSEHLDFNRSETV